jgi:hypothetical protein
MLYLAEQAALGQGDVNSLRSRLSSIASCSFIPDEQATEAIISGWEQAVNQFIEDVNLSQEEENHLTRFAAHFNLTQNDLDGRGFYTQFVQGRYCVRSWKAIYHNGCKSIQHCPSIFRNPKPLSGFSSGLITMKTKPAGSM